MEFFKITLEGMKKLLDDCNKNSYSDIIQYCLERWNNNNDVSFFLSSFSEKGAFRKMAFNPTEFESLEKFFWTQQLFSALSAMAIQLASFIKQKKNCNIDFIRKNFGHNNQVITGSACSKCGSRQINMTDVDHYISTPIIAKRIVDGLENKNLIENIEAIMNLSAPEIQIERERTKTRILNSSIPLSQSRNKRTFCLTCGNNEIKRCKFIKSLKEVIFVPLSTLE